MTPNSYFKFAKYEITKMSENGSLSKTAKSILTPFFSHLLHIHNNYVLKYYPF